MKVKQDEKAEEKKAAKAEAKKISKRDKKERQIREKRDRCSIFSNKLILIVGETDPRKEG